MKTAAEYTRDIRHAVIETLYDHFAGAGIAVYVNGLLDSRLDETIKQQVLEIMAATREDVLNSVEFTEE